MTEIIKLNHKTPVINEVPHQESGENMNVMRKKVDSTQRLKVNL